MHSLFRHVRTVSTRARPTRTSVFVDTLLQETNEPLWRILLAIRQPDFKAANVIIPDYERWRPLTRSHGLASALNEIKGEPPPLWLALYLLAYGVRAHNDAYPAGLDLAYAHLTSAPQHLHGPLLIFAVSSLSRFNLLLPIRRVINTFLTTELAPHSELYFNLFLQALTITPMQSTETAQTIVQLLRRMEARKLGLVKETYDLLLNDELVTIHLAHFLRSHMTRHGSIPTTPQLEAYLRIFAKKGSAEEATELYSAIQHRATPTDTLHKDARLLATRPNQPEPFLNRSDKLFLSTRADSTAATEYLRKLLNPRFRAKPKLFDLKNLDLNKPKLTIIPRDPAPDVFAFTASLSSLAANRDSTAGALVSLFEKVRARRDIEPNQVTYTVLLQALYERQEWDLAMKYWNEYYESGLLMDRKSLGVGMRVLTRFKRPHVAFGLLQKWAYRLNLSKRELEAVEDENGFSESEVATKSTAEGMKTVSRSYYRVSLSVITLNDWLATLNRISRPDIVLAAWDAFRPLYNVTPDARTLTILLAATRRACRLNGTSLKGLVVRMKYDIRDTFGANHPSSPQREIGTDDAQLNLETLLGPPNAEKPKPYKPSLWHGRLPADHARLLFLQAMFGAAPDPKALMDVEPPARATRKRAPSEEGEEVWGGLNMGLPKWREEGVDTWESLEWEALLRKRRRVVSRPKESEEVNPIWLEEGDTVEENVANRFEEDVNQAVKEDEWEWDSYHPSIIPTNETFLHYILLLGLTGRASEIARVLAWMRHLKIVPHRSTLAASLVLWGEVSGRAVLVERWTRRRKSSPSISTEEVDEPPWMRGPLAEDVRSALNLAKDEERERAMMLTDAPEQHERLLTWLHEWVPIYMMPSPRSMALWTRNVEWLRNGGRPVWEAEEAIRETEAEEEGGIWSR
ncbi:hypothetical protein C0989_012523 [Termitomyces sp. Mn162]|nr:hypothetical protein C0989_012523 [Termitomyces sp. Mn162]